MHFWGLFEGVLPYWFAGWGSQVRRWALCGCCGCNICTHTATCILLQYIIFGKRASSLHSCTLTAILPPRNLVHQDCSNLFWILNETNDDSDRHLSPFSLRPSKALRATQERNRTKNERELRGSSNYATSPAKFLTKYNTNGLNSSRVSVDTRANRILYFN